MRVHSPRAVGIFERNFASFCAFLNRVVCKASRFKFHPSLTTRAIVSGYGIKQHFAFTVKGILIRRSPLSLFYCCFHTLRLLVTGCCSPTPDCGPDLTRSCWCMPTGIPEDCWLCFRKIAVKRLTQRASTAPLTPFIE
jgi:hypothetical protein